MIELIDNLVPIFTIVGIFGMPVFIILIYFYFANKSKEQFHTTLQKLIENGQELSPELLHSCKSMSEVCRKLSYLLSGS